jgi:hypothetical protein
MHHNGAIVQTADLEATKVRIYSLVWTASLGMTVVGRRRGRQSGDWRSRECGAGQAAVATIDEAEFAPDPAGN